MVDLNYENNRILDVVDENDQVIGAMPRLEVHRQGLLHREIQIFMFDENKNIIFQRKGLHKSSAGVLDPTVAGHLNQGEGYLEAAIRETKEETGMDINASDLFLFKKIMVSNLPKNDFGHPVNNFIRSIYIYKKPIQDNMLQKEEGIQGGGFKKFSYEFLINMSPEDWKMFHHSMPTMLPDVLKYLEKWKN